MAQIFLTAAWKKLAMANYPVDPAILQPLLPANTELDTWQGETYVSLVGFQFREVKVRGVYIPFHKHFPEVNLRFYVRYKEGTQWKRGVVFIREIVPLPAVTFIANNLFKERYITLPMKVHEKREGSLLEVGYQWNYHKHWHQLSVQADSSAQPLKTGSKEEFITEHFWGYARVNATTTAEYQVAHPRWDIYNVKTYTIDCDFGKLYGAPFSYLGSQKPASVFLAEGSPVEVYTKKII